MNLFSEEYPYTLPFSLSYVLREIMMECKDPQPSNASKPRLVTESGMETDCRDGQLRNAWSPMLVTELGMVTDCKDWQPSNTPKLMLVTESGMVTECKDLHHPYLYLVITQYFTY